MGLGATSDFRVSYRSHRLAWKLDDELRQEKIVREIILVTSWVIWKLLNNVVFMNVRVNDMSLFDGAVNFSFICYLYGKLRTIKADRADSKASTIHNFFSI